MNACVNAFSKNIFTRSDGKTCSLMSDFFEWKFSNSSKLARLDFICSICSILQRWISRFWIQHQIQHQIQHHHWKIPQGKIRLNSGNFSKFSVFRYLLRLICMKEQIRKLKKSNIFSNILDFSTFSRFFVQHVYLQRGAVTFYEW